ncbi:MAG: glycosyltransferase [Sulfurospirillum sp.]|nr:glycosyltransferase [Sulfurospirillum sp.]
MKKILYVTDREEYSEHNFIGPLFEKYLPLYAHIDIVYFSDYKSYAERKNKSIIIPTFDRKKLFAAMQEIGIDAANYDFVLVRNMHDVLEYVLDQKQKYNFKVGFRLSFPKIAASLEKAKAEKSSNLLQVVDNKIKTYTKSKLINKCDIFLPTSKQMQEVYYPDVNVPIFTIPSAIDPQRVQKKECNISEKIIFAYIGTLSELRDFKSVLAAFSTLTKDNWALHISTNDVTYAQDCIKSYGDIADKIQIISVKTKDELFAFMAQCDVGLSLLPDLNIFNTSVHLKIMDYYTAGMPALMSENQLNSTIFEDEKNAWLCDFSVTSMAKKLEKIISMPKQKICEVGDAGQTRLLEVRNYETIAKKLSEMLAKL